MKVRTLKQHINSHGPQPVKNIGRIYDLPDAEALSLIDAGIVEKADGNQDKD